MDVPCIRMVAIVLVCTLCASCATSSLVTADDPISAVLERSYVKIGDASYLRVGRNSDTLICVAEADRVRFENPGQRMYARDECGTSYQQREITTAFIEMHSGRTLQTRGDSVFLPMADISHVSVLAAQPGNVGTGTIALSGVLLFLIGSALFVVSRFSYWR